MTAKKPETRVRRIETFVAMLAKKPAPAKPKAAKRTVKPRVAASR